MRGRTGSSWLVIPLLALGIFTLAVAQVSLVPWLHIGGITADVLLASTIAVALHFGPWSGLLWGMSLGLTADILAAHPLGILALPLALVGYGSGLAHVWVLESRVLVPLVAGFAGTLAYALLQMPVTWAWGYPIALDASRLRAILFMGLYTTVWTWVGFLLLLIVHRLQRRERLRVHM